MNARTSWNRKYFTDKTNKKDINDGFEQVNHIKTELVKCRLQSPVVQRPISAGPGLNFNAGFYISFFQNLLEKIFPILFRTSNDQIASKKILTEFSFKLFDLKSNSMLTLGYLNPDSNNPGQNRC